MPAVAVLDFAPDDLAVAEYPVDECPFDALGAAEETQPDTAVVVAENQAAESPVEESPSVQVEPLNFEETSPEKNPAAEILSQEKEKSQTPNFDAAEKTFSEKRNREYVELLNKRDNLETQISIKKFSVADQSALVRTMEGELKDEKKSLKTQTDELIQAEKELEKTQGKIDAFDWTEGEPQVGSQSPAISAAPSLAEPSPAAAGSEVATPASPTRRRKPDPGITTDLWELKSHAGPNGKVTDSMLEKLQGVDVRTVKHLEEYMGAGNFVPGRVKGLGETAIDKLTDALMNWRKKNPVPGENDFEDVEPEVAAASAPTLADAGLEAVSALADDAEENLEEAAYVAGCEASVSDQLVTANPHEKGTQLWCAWDKGWQETNAQDTREQ